MGPCPLARSVDHLSLRLVRIDLEFASNGIERDHLLCTRPVNPGVLARPRQARQHRHFATGVVVSAIFWIAFWFSKPEEPRVIAGEWPWTIQTALLAAVLDEQSNVVEYALLIFIARAAPSLG